MDQATREVVSASPRKLLTNIETRRQSYCPNLGAFHANGDILAFLDSGWVAESAWPRELEPGFLWEPAGAMGGYVEGYSDRSELERYEQKLSPLDLGRYLQWRSEDPSPSYLPMCNMLVLKKALGEVRGLRETLHWLGVDCLLRGSFEYCLL